MSPFSLLLAVFLLFTGCAGACADAGGTRIEQLRSETPEPDARTAHKQLAFLVPDYTFRGRAEETGRDFGEGKAKAVCPAQPCHDPLILARRIGMQPEAPHPASIEFGISRPRGPPSLTAPRRIG